MSERVPLLLVSDAITMPTGLGRITRELAVRIHEELSDVIEVGICGYGASYSKKFPIPQYTVSRLENWAIPELPVFWKDFAGDREGIIFTIWNASWLPWFTNPDILGECDLKKFLKSNSFKRWGYFPIDAEGPNGRMHKDHSDIIAKYDRKLAYTEWAAGVIKKSFDRDGTIHRVPPWLPHGTDSSIFYPRDRDEARRTFIERVIPNVKGMLHPGRLIVGVCATNTKRKDWPLAFQVCQELLKRGHEVGLWAHTDHIRGGEWDLLALSEEYGMKERVIYSNVHLSDEDLAWAYAACNVTLGIGRGEGWGLPLSESLACGVPVITGDYAAAQQFVPLKYRVPVSEFELEGYYLNFRPVFKPTVWADCVESALDDKDVSLDHRYTWDGCWEDWKKWILAGI